jgi:cell wall-associated NlpC family hydrolase
MKPFVSTPEQADAIRSLANQWLGTPYAADGAVKGSGVSCHMLPSIILVEAGFAHPTPPRRGRMLRCELLPAMLAWLQAHKETHFTPIVGTPAQAGDVLLFDAGTGHLALALDEHNVIHSWQRQGAHVSNFRIPTLLSRLKGIWRPAVSS